jgi:hypothetical protein
MSSYDNFKGDLSRGVTVESKVVAMLQKRYPCAVRIEGKFKDYDIWIPELEKGVEVKYDPMSNQTGNIVVEIEMRGVPSALLTTKAAWWVFYDDHVFALIKPINIIKCVMLNRLLYSEFTGNGDIHSKKAYLIKKEMLFEYATRIVDNSGVEKISS